MIADLPGDENGNTISKGIIDIGSQASDLTVEQDSDESFDR